MQKTITRLKMPFSSSGFIRYSCLLLVMCLFSVTSFAQVATYTFAQSSGTYTPVLITSTRVAASTAADGIDENVYTTTLPFAFTYNGVAYAAGATVNISSNGFITFGTTVPSTSDYTPISATAAYDGVVAPMAVDMENNAFAFAASSTSGSTTITGIAAATVTALQIGEPITGGGIPAGSYIVTKPTTTSITISAAATTTSTANKRVGGVIQTATVGSDFVIQFQNWAKYAYNGVAIGYNFQVRLTQTTNVVSIVYGANSTTYTGTSFPQVGLRGAAGTDFNNRAGTTWAATTAGTTNADVVTTNSTTVPTSGLTFTYTPAVATPKVLGTIASVQQTGTVGRSSTNNNILRIDVPVTGTSGTLTLNSLIATYTGTSASDVAANGVKLWTGTATAPTTQIGTAASLSGGTATFSGLTTSLAFGTNYLWVTLDAAATAVLGNNMDAKIAAGNIVIAASGGATAPGSQPATALDPAGSRLIDYCAVSASTPARFINNFSTTGATTNITNNGTGYSTNGYTNYSATIGATATQGTTVNVSIAGDGTGTYTYAVFIDYNQNGLFSDAGEAVFSTSSFASSATGSFVVPVTALAGTTRMRVIADYNNITASTEYCTAITGGEFEDYAFTVVAAPPCVAPTAPATAFALPTVTSTTASGSFTAASSAPSGYVIFRSTTNTTPVPADGTAYPTAANYTIGGVSYRSIAYTGTTISETALTANTTYYYWIFPYNNTACSGGPLYYTATPATATITTCTAAPATLTGTTTGTTTADVSFGTVAGATSYVLQYRVNGTTIWLTASPAPTASPYSLTGLTAGTTYDVQVSGAGTACSTFKTVTSAFTTQLLNDDCSGAIAITPGDNTCNAVTGTNVGASASTGFPTASCTATGVADDVWYTFTVAATGPQYKINLTPTVSGRWSIVLYSSTTGDCSGLVFNSCLEGTAGGGIVNLDAGILPAGTYYYRLYARSAYMNGYTTCVQKITSVTTSAITGSPFCAGSVLSVPFTSVGSYSGNTYTAQLSDASGSFAAPVTLGTLVSNANSGTISGTIPAATASGSGYLVRVVASSPAITGSTTAITVNGLPTAPSVSPATATICAGTVQSLTASGSVAPAGAQLLGENFSSVAAGNIPAGWSKLQTTTATWSAATTALAGGTANEMVFNATGATMTETGIYALSSVAVDATGWTGLNISFKYMVDNFNVGTYPYTIKLQTSPDANTWTDRANYTPTGTADIAATTASVSISALDGQPTAYFRFVLTGLPYGINEWYIDDISVTGTPPVKYTWTPITNLYINAGATTAYTLNTAATTVYAKPTTTATYTVTATAAGTGCASNTQASAVLTVNPLPTATISGTTSVCSGGTASTITFTGANGTAPYTFTYSLNGGSNSTVVSTGNTATVTAPNTGGTYAYTLVSVQDASTTACTNPQTGTATVTVYQTPSITSTSLNCNQITVTSPAITGPGSIQYSFDGGNSYGASNTSGTLASGSSYTVMVSNSGMPACASAGTTVNTGVTGSSIAVSSGSGSDNGSCSLTDGGSYITLRNAAGNYIADVKDNANGTSLGNTPVTLTVDGSAGTFTTGETFMRRHFIITPASLSNNQADVKLYFTQADLDDMAAALGISSSNVLSGLTIARFDGGAQSPASYTSVISIAPTVVNYGNGIYSANFTTPGFSGFYPYYTLSTPLPVKLVSLGATNEGTRNKIAWQSAVEDGLATYEVQRSKDGISFDKMATVAAEGKAYGYISYDQAPFTGVTYYRLRMIDSKGAATLSNTVSAIMKSADGFSLAAHPNPVSDVLTIDVSNAAGTARIQLTDVTGKVIAVTTADNGKVTFSMAAFTSGIYYIRYSDDNHTQTIKINKQ